MKARNLFIKIRTEIVSVIVISRLKANKISDYFSCLCLFIYDIVEGNGFL